MGDDDGLLRLVKTLSAFFTEGIAVEEDLTYSLTSEFLRNIQDVLYTKQLVVFARLESFFCIYLETMIASTEMYLRHVIFACLQIKREKIFEGLLGVLALMLRSSVETRYRTRVNFCNLVPDVFMVFYENELKEPFRKSGGFRQFVKYINDPKYLEEKRIVRNISDSYDHIASVSEISKDLRQKIFGMMSGNENLVTSFDCRKAVQHQYSLTLAKKVLKTTKIELLPKPSDGLNANLPNLYPQKMTQIDKRPTYFEAIGNLINLEFYSEPLAKGVLKITKPEFIPKLNDNDLNVNESDSVRKKMDEKKKILEISEGDLKETSERRSSSSSNSKTNDDTVLQMAENTKYENIIESVIRHNHSKSLCHVKTESRFQIEADRNLEHMKSTIDSLIQVLDEYDKE